MTCSHDPINSALSDLAYFHHKSLFCRIMSSIPSIKDYIDQRRRCSLPDAADITSATTAENGDVLLTIRVSEKEKEDEAVDTSGFEYDTLDKLRVQDPFLYYSIKNDLRRRSSCASEADVGAGVLSTSDSFEEASASNASSVTQHSSRGPARRTSMPNMNSSPSQARRHSLMAATNIVKRQRRLSTETHPSLMYESMFADLDLDESEEIKLDEVEEEDLLCFIKDDSM